MATPVFRDYQLKALARFRQETSAFLAMEMRLGKSRVAIEWLLRKACDGLPPAKRVLVVAPSTVLWGWLEELKLFEISGFPIWTMESVQDRITTAKLVGGWHLLNYEAVSRFPRSLLESYDAVILDESTRIKNPKAEVTKALLAASGQIRYKCCLSGLPTPEDWSELWSQCAFLGGGWWMRQASFWKWRKYWQVKMGFEWKTPSTSVPEIVRAFDAVAFRLTRAQAGITDTFVHEIRKSPANPAALAIKKHILKKWSLPREYEEHGTSSETITSLVVCNWLQQLAGGFCNGKLVDPWKINEIQSIRQEIPATDPIVVWVAFNEEGHTLSRALGAPFLCGDSPQEERARVLASFQAGAIPILIVQQALGQFGLRLSNASVAIYYSCAFSCEKRNQSRDRIVDVSSQETKLVIDLHTAGSIDEEIFALLQEKKDNASLLFSRLFGTDKPTKPSH